MIDARSKVDRLVDFIIVIVMLALGVVMLYPMLYEVFVSFSEPAELIKHRAFCSGL